MISEEAIKISFDRAKNHIKQLEAEITQIKGILEEIKEELKAIKLSPKTQVLDNFDENINKSSIGNKGVLNNPQYPSIPNTQYTSIPQSMINMKKELEDAFRTLTDREFSIFMAIYALDKEGKEASYQDLAKQLNISEHTIRGYIGSLLYKNIPIEKVRYLNGKVSLSIKNEFKTLNLYEKLLKLKVSRQGQKTLFDI